MSDVMTWFAMCPAARAVPLGDLVRDLRWAEYERARLEGDTVFIEVDDRLMKIAAEIQVTFSNEAHVAEETREIVEDHGEDRDDRDQVAGFDARYELSWDADHYDSIFTTLTTVLTYLRRTCGAVVFDTWNEEFFSFE